MADAALTTTTANVCAYAAQHFATLRGAADDHLRTALSRRGEVATQKARAIDSLHEQLLGSLCLVSLLAALGDRNAADRAEADWHDTGRYLLEASHAARMASVPGWNPATRSFDRARPGSLA